MAFDEDGNMLAETYPNGMTANYTYDATDTPTALTYTAPLGCTSSCTWYSDSIDQTPQGLWADQTSSLATENYTYDQDDRLTQVQETLTGQGCNTRQYIYGADTNRLSEISEDQPEGSACSDSGEGSSTVSHSYDAADRLTDTGVSYDAWGNTITLPAADAGGYALTDGYYANNRVYTQSQNGTTITYTYDPDDRTEEQVTSGTGAETLINHYSDDSDNPAWTDYGSGDWTRYVSGIDGNFVAQQSSGGSMSLEMIDLHGDVIGTENNSENAMPSLTLTTDEFGVPESSANPGRYSYLGAHQRTTTPLASAMIDMGARDTTLISAGSSRSTRSSGETRTPMTMPTKTRSLTTISLAKPISTNWRPC